MDVIVAYDPEKLPPDIKLLLDSNRLLPPGTQFFEEKYSFADLAKQFLWGIALLPAGALALFLAVLFTIAADRASANYSSMMNAFFVAGAVGVILIAGGFMLLLSLRSKYQLIRRQQKGVATRHGVFLLADMLIYRGDSATKVIPKPSFRGLKGREVQYEQAGETKSFSLPAALVGKDVNSLDIAIGRWAT